MNKCCLNQRKKREKKTNKKSLGNSQIVLCFAWFALFGLLAHKNAACNRLVVTSLLQQTLFIE